MSTFWVYFIIKIYWMSISGGYTQRLSTGSPFTLLRSVVVANLTKQPAPGLVSNTYFMTLCMNGCPSTLPNIWETQVNSCFGPLTRFRMIVLPPPPPFLSWWIMHLFKPLAFMRPPVNCSQQGIFTAGSTKLALSINRARTCLIHLNGKAEKKIMYLNWYSFP